MALEIRKAERAKSKLRVGLSGPSGSGKTYSALLMARGLASAWDKILLIDTENGSGELYSDLGDYNIITLDAPYAPERYIEAMQAGQKAGMEAIILDSVSHEWDGKGGCLQINEMLANAKYKGNTWAAWSETTPRHQRFIEAITTANCHMITTARSKTDTIQTDDKKIKKLGLKDIQRDGFEYELTTAFNIDRDNHLALASKDRTKLFIDRDPFVIGQETGEELLAWSQSGRDVPIDYTKEKTKIVQLLKMLGVTIADAGQAAEAVKVRTGLELIPENYIPIIERLELLVQEAREGVKGRVERDEGAVVAAAAKVEETPTVSVARVEVEAAVVEAATALEPKVEVEAATALEPVAAVAAA